MRTGMALLSRGPSARMAGPSGPLAWTVQLLAIQHYFKCSIENCFNIVIIGHYNICYCSGLGSLKKKLVGRFQSKCCRVDDADYNPAADSKDQSSASGSAFLYTEDVHQSHRAGSVSYGRIDHRI